MIVISDLHLKYKHEPYSSSQRQFLDWLNEKYYNEHMIFLGDLFDVSPHWEVYKMFQDFLLNRNGNTYILNGNHANSKNKGSSIIAFDFESVYSYLDVSEFEIENCNCLMLPFNYDYRKYSELEGSYDFIFTHVTPTQVQFANEGIDFPKLKGTFIHGHTHMPSKFTDRYNNEHIVLGVPLPTRHLEAFEHKIIEIKNKQINYIDVPFYFKYETIEYGVMPENKTNVYNIINAPSKKAVLDKYKDYYIRNHGIKLLRNEFNHETLKDEFESGNILSKFNIFIQEKQLSEEVAKCCSERIQQII
jgi:hypothetical protein